MEENSSKPAIFVLALAFYVFATMPAQAGYAVDGTKKGVNEGVGGTKKGVKEGVGGTKKGVKETKKFFKKVF